MVDGHALVDAMLYGKLDGLGPETIFLFGRTGLIHLFSASGFHMSAALLLARMATFAGSPVLPPRHRALLAFMLSIALMTFFGAKTEWSSPLVRAYAFAALLAAATLFEVKPSRTWVFLLSLLLAALFGKGSFLSWLLSALGMAGILWAGTGIVSLALAPWIFTLPVVVWEFGLFSLSAPFWNLSFGLLVSATVLPLSIVDLLLQELGISWRGLHDLATWLMARLTACLQAGDALMGLSYWVNARAFPLSLLAFLLGIALAQRYKKKKLSLSLFLLGICLPFLLPKPKLVMLDVGQGDAIWLRISGGESLLVDGGPPGFRRKGNPALVRAWETEGLGSLDHLLLTHTDRDHWGGLPHFLLRHPVRKGLWLRETALEDTKALPLLEAAERAGIPVLLLQQEQTPPGLRCWLPPPASANESSPLCHASLEGGRSVWLTGDAGHRSENWLLAQEESIPQAEILKVGHHGSKGSTGLAFAFASGAKIALVSAGRKNRYGHPAPLVLDRLERLGVAVRRTDQEGTIRLY